MKPSIDILIVEDNIIIAEDLSNILSDLGYNVVGIAMTYYEAIDLIHLKKPTLCHLDIVIKGEKDGINLAETIQSDFNIPFLYITSHSDKLTVDRAKKTRPKGYIIKPFDQEDIYTSIEIATIQSEPEDQLNPSILIRHNGSLKKVQLSNILYIQSDRNYLDIYASNEKRYVIRQALKDFLGQPNMTSFQQVHKSYAVNLNYVESVGVNFVKVQGTDVPLGRTHVATLKKSLIGL